VYQVRQELKGRVPPPRGKIDGGGGEGG